MCVTDHFGKTGGYAVRLQAGNPQPLSIEPKDRPNTPLQVFPVTDDPCTETDVDYRVLNGPVPVVFRIKAGKQVPFSFEKFFQRIQEQALAERRGRDRKKYFP